MENKEIKVAEFKVEGWKAVLLLGCLVLFMGYRTFTSEEVTDDKIFDALETEIQMEYQRAVLPTLQNAVDQRYDSMATRLAGEITDTEVEFFEVCSNKQLIPFFTPDEIIVRVDYQLHHGDVSEARKTRYYSFERQGFNGWWLQRETTKLSYYLDRIL